MFRRFGRFERLCCMLGDKCCELALKVCMKGCAMNELKVT